MMWIYVFLFNRKEFRLGLAEAMVGWILKILPPGDEAIEFAQFIVNSRWFTITAPNRWKTDVNKT